MAIAETGHVKFVKFHVRTLVCTKVLGVGHVLAGMLTQQYDGHNETDSQSPTEISYPGYSLYGLCCQVTTCPKTQ